MNWTSSGLAAWDVWEINCSFMNKGRWLWLNKEGVFILHFCHCKLPQINWLKMTSTHHPFPNIRSLGLVGLNWILCLDTQRGQNQGMGTAVFLTGGSRTEDASRLIQVVSQQNLVLASVKLRRLFPCWTPAACPEPPRPFSGPHTSDPTFTFSHARVQQGFFLTFSSAVSLWLLPDQRLCL